MSISNHKLTSLFPINTRTTGAIVSIASISLAHYAGFLSAVPLQIVAASGPDLALGVTATFLFYTSFSAILARIVAPFLITYILVMLVFIERAEHGTKLETLSKKKKFVRSYSSLIDNETYLATALQIGLFIIIMSATYLEPSPSWTSATLLTIASILLALPGLLKTRFLLLLNIKKYLNRIYKRPHERARAISAGLLTTITALVVSSYTMGLMRINMLTNSEPQQITNRYFKGHANLLATSGSSALVYEKINNQERYMYLTADYALAVESEPNSFSILGSKSE